MDFQNSPTFEGSACFYVTIPGNFERFRYFNFKAIFFGKQKPFSETLAVFQLKALISYKTVISEAKVKMDLQNGPVT